MWTYKCVLFCLFVLFVFVFCFCFCFLFLFLFLFVCFVFVFVFIFFIPLKAFKITLIGHILSFKKSCNRPIAFRLCFQTCQMIKRYYQQRLEKQNTSTYHLIIPQKVRFTYGFKVSCQHLNYIRSALNGTSGFLIRLLGSPMFTETFNLVTRVGVQWFLEHWKIEIF